MLIWLEYGKGTDQHQHETILSKHNGLYTGWYIWKNKKIRWIIHEISSWLNTILSRLRTCPHNSKMGQSMFGTSNFGTEVTSTPSCGLRHQMLTSAPCKMTTCRSSFSHNIRYHFILTSGTDLQICHQHRKSVTNITLISY